MAAPMPREAPVTMHTGAAAATRRRQREVDEDVDGLVFSVRWMGFFINWERRKSRSPCVRAWRACEHVRAVFI